jgi:hypothetical protein
MPHQKNSAQHRSQGSTARNVINALRQRQTQHKPKPKPSCFDWFKPSNFSKRLNDNVTFAYIVDSITYIVSAASDSANDYLLKGTPAILNGISCVAPALIPFIPNIICLCQQNQDKSNVELEEYQAEVDELFAPIMLLLPEIDENNRARMLVEIEKVKKTFVDKFIEDKAAEQTSTLENVINIIYLLVRGVGGALIMIKGCQDLDEDGNAQLENIGKWMTVGSTAAYLLYYLICLLPAQITNYCKSKKDDVLSDSDDDDLIDEEEKEAALTSQAPLSSIVVHAPGTSQIIPQTLFSPKSSSRLKPVDVVPTAEMLTEPLLSTSNPSSNALIYM